MRVNNYNLKPNIGNRFAAVLVDYIIIYTFFFWFVYQFGVPNEEGGYTVNGLPAFIPVLFWGIITIGFEQIFGATLGNLLVGLKPISIKEDSGNDSFKSVEEKITFPQSFKRHLLDPIDMFLFGLIAIITIKNTDKNQRLGDLWAKTVVVHNSDKT